MNQAKRAQEEQDEWDSIPKETKEAVKRKEQRHKLKEKNEARLREKAAKVAKRDSIDPDLAMQ